MQSCASARICPSPSMPERFRRALWRFVTVCLSLLVAPSCLDTGSDDLEPPDHECQSDSDCPLDEFCSKAPDNAVGVYRCQEGCRRNEQCVSGSVCIGGRCERPCLEDTDCPTEMICVG